MWARGLVGAGVAMGGFLMVPAMLATMQGTRLALAAGLAARRAVEREMARVAFEAAERIEDLVAEVRMATAAAADAAVPAVEIVAGRVAGGGRAVAVRPADAALLHAAPARLRLRLRGAGAEAAAEGLADALAGFPGVRRARARPLTASVVVETEGPAEAVARSLERAGVLRLAAVHVEHPAALATGLALARIDALIRLRSAGRADLRSVVAMLIRAADILAARAAGAARASAGAGGARG